jgi:hypothetical protein
MRAFFAGGIVAALKIRGRTRINQPLLRSSGTNALSRISGSCPRSRAVQTFASFLAAQAAGGYDSYFDLVTRDVLELRRPAGAPR